MSARPEPGPPEDRPAEQWMVEEWMAEHLPRRARVRYPEGWSWPGRPHPDCRQAEFRLPPDDDPGAPEERWTLVRGAVPHDAHVLASGQRCPGAAGTVPGTRRAVHEDRLAGAVVALTGAQQRLREAEREVARLATEVARARALIARCDDPGGRGEPPAATLAG